MRVKKKVLLVILSVVLVLSISVGGTFAYLSHSAQHSLSLHPDDSNIEIHYTSWHTSSSDKWSNTSGSVPYIQRAAPWFTLRSGVSYVRAAISVTKNGVSQNMSSLMHNFYRDPYLDVTVSSETGVGLGNPSSVPISCTDFGGDYQRKSISFSADFKIVYVIWDMPIHAGEVIAPFTHYLTGYSGEQVTVELQAIDASNNKYASSTEAFAALDTQIANGTAKSIVRTTNKFGG